MIQNQNIDPLFSSSFSDLNITTSLKWNVFQSLEAGNLVTAFNSLRALHIQISPYFKKHRDDAKGLLEANKKVYASYSGQKRGMPHPIFLKWQNLLYEWAEFLNRVGTEAGLIMAKRADALESIKEL